MEWFYKKDGEECGPLDDESFAAAIVDGLVTMDTPIWHDGLEDWTLLSKIVDSAGVSADDTPVAAPPPLPPPPPPPTPPPTPPPARVQLVQRTAPPPVSPPPEAQSPGSRNMAASAPAPHPASPAPAPSTKATLATPVTPAPGGPVKPRPPGVFRRLLADVLDTAFLLGAGWAAFKYAPANLKTPDMALPFSGALVAAVVLLPALFLIVSGRTPGLLLLGLKLRAMDDRHRCGGLKCLAYPIAMMISLCSLGAGWFTGLLTDDRRPLHDMIAGTRAVK